MGIPSPAVTLPTCVVLFLVGAGGCTGTNTGDPGSPVDAYAGDTPETAVTEDGDAGPGPGEPDGGEISEPAPDVPEAIQDGGEPEALCPTAQIHIEEGTQVLPQTLLHLDGSQSGEGGPLIVAYEWTVQQPDGSSAVFKPNSTTATPTFLVNVAGEYTFTLMVWDEFGVPSCEPAVVTVMVQPGDGIHIELLWDTPGDIDQTDQGPQAGADMDLHFAHWMSMGQGPNADGAWDGWFDQPFDCFWFNPVPNWGNLDPTVADDPTLDLDDTDGAGPEILNLVLPESGLSADDRYKIGVHHWSDNGHGPSVPEVRIYINGELTYSQHGPTMDGHDLWFVGEIAWPSGEVTPLEADGGAVLIEDYSSPFMPN